MFKTLGSSIALAQRFLTGGKFSYRPKKTFGVWSDVQFLQYQGIQLLSKGRKVTKMFKTRRSSIALAQGVLNRG